ncbi:MAG TPA: HAMP domain-containing protein, partial [Thauera aminoaromatica]|nr:HAMP domain-containing protein [Thauera aminoaromatica]
MYLAVPRLLVRRSIMLLVSVALVAMTLIGLAGMSASFVVVDRSRDSVQAIAVASTLRGHTQRIANLIAIDALKGRIGVSERTRAAMADIERELQQAPLRRFVDEAPGELFAATYRGVQAGWERSVRPRIEALAGPVPPDAREVETLLAGVDDFVGQVDSLVAVLGQENERRIDELRRILALAAAVTLGVVLVVIVLLQRALLRPLGGLLDAARRIAGGDFGVRVRYTGEDELGQVGSAFNLMADELARHYHLLELRVTEKTAELQRSNRSLELLYHAIARLYQAPSAPDAYEATLRDIDRVAGLEGSFVCIEPR